MKTLQVNLERYVKYTWKDVPKQFVEPLSHVLRSSIQTRIRTLKDLSEYHKVLPTILFTPSSKVGLESFYGLKVEENIVEHYEHYIILYSKTDDELDTIKLEWI